MQFDAVHNRHIPVGKYQIEFVLCQFLQPLSPIFGLYYFLEAHALQHSADKFAHAESVFD